MSVFPGAPNINLWTNVMAVMQAPSLSFHISALQTPAFTIALMRDEYWMQERANALIQVLRFQGVASHGLLTVET